MKIIILIKILIFIIKDRSVKKIKLKEIYYNENYNTYQNFNFHLNRSVKNFEIQIENINKIFKVFKELDNFDICLVFENYFIGKNCDMIFEYEFEKDGICDFVMFSIKDL